MLSGHRIGTAEVESALVSHPQCAEAAVVGVEHEVLQSLSFIFVQHVSLPISAIVQEILPICIYNFKICVGQRAGYLCIRYLGRGCSIQ